MPLQRCFQSYYADNIIVALMLQSVNSMGNFANWSVLFKGEDKQQRVRLGQ